MTTADNPPAGDPRSGRDRTTIALLTAAILLVLFARFNSINGVILPYLQRATDPGLYAQDFFINT
ncbi:MAG: hypothetical protein EOP61_24755, partial [Sphingomonadales bacterium]